MKRRVRVAALLLLLLLLLGGLTLSAIFAQMSQDVPAAARGRTKNLDSGSLDLEGAGSGGPYNVTCIVRTVESPDPPVGATCRFLFLRMDGFGGVDETFVLTLPEGTTMVLPEGAVGNLTGTAPGYRAQTREVGVWSNQTIPFYLRTALEEPAPQEPSSGAPVTPPPPPPPPARPEPGPGAPEGPPQGITGTPPPTVPPKYQAPICDDDVDNDNDGLTDFPNDPGCLNAQDDDEFNNSTVLPPSVRFGRPGAQVWDQYTSTMGAGEPTIGINWKAGNFDSPKVMMQFDAATIRADFGGYSPPGPYNPTGNFPTDASGNELPPAISWTNTNNQWSVTNVDPYLWTDHVTGRTWAGGLNGQGSIFGVSDDNGVTWSQPAYANPFAAWDHESLASGRYASPPPPTATYPSTGAKVAVYYCAQTGAGSFSCGRSDDGGTSWIPVLQAYTGCPSGLHGHPRVSPADGSVYVPAKSCGGGANGLAMSLDNGLNWNLRTVPGSTANGAFDPALGISRANAALTPPSAGNWLYYAQGDDSGVHVALSTQADRLDLGLNLMGGGNGVNGGNGAGWLDLGALATPPVVRAVFPNVEVGDDRRAAVSFLGSTQAFNHQACVANQKWYYYIAYTYDGGSTWTVHRMSDDPVQSGGVWLGQGGNGCRNLLDFNNLQMDAHGRLYVGFGDGCISPCTATSSGQGTTNTGAIFRQRTGCGLFRAFDEPGVPALCTFS